VCLYNTIVLLIRYAIFIVGLIFLFLRETPTKEALGWGHFICQHKETKIAVL